MPENLPYFEDIMAQEIPIDTEGMKKYYQTFLTLSANFHVAFEDWDKGMICNSHHDTFNKTKAFQA